MGINIQQCTEAAELYRHYEGQTEPQPAYIELALNTGSLSASYNAEIGNAIPFTVYHGFERRYSIPVLTAEAANQAMERIVPLAERIVADSDTHWDGNNTVIVLGDDARAAEAEIEDYLEGNFDESDEVTVWGIDGATNGEEAELYQITPATTDERLAEIAATITTDMVECSASDVVIVEGIEDYLEDLRADLTEHDN